MFLLILFKFDRKLNSRSMELVILLFYIRSPFFVSIFKTRNYTKCVFTYKIFLAFLLVFIYDTFCIVIVSMLVVVGRTVTESFIMAFIFNSFFFYVKLVHIECLNYIFKPKKNSFDTK